METKLFTTEQVKDFFNRLDKMGRVCEERYNKRCEREVFVRRALRFLRKKHIILYEQDKSTGLQFKKYISINNISFALGYGSDLTVYYYDYSRPAKVYNEMTVSHNDALRLEGEWCSSNEKHQILAEMCVIDAPLKNFYFKTYNLKTTKKGKFEEKLMSVQARTHIQADRLWDKKREELKGEFVFVPDWEKIELV